MSALLTVLPGDAHHHVKNKGQGPARVLIIGGFGFGVGDKVPPEEVESVIAKAGYPDVPTAKTDRKRIKIGFEKLNFVAYNYAALAPDKFKNFFKWRKKVVESKLKYFVPWHIASFAYSPIKMENRIYGLALPKYMRLLAEVLKRLGYKRVMVVHGVDGLDEISNLGVTKIIEVESDKIREYELSPTDFAVQPAKIADIEIKSKDESITKFLKAVSGKGNKALQDLVAVNAGAAFYLTGKKKTLKEGTDYALDLIAKGKVANKLKEIVSFYKRKFLRALLEKTE